MPEVHLRYWAGARAAAGTAAETLTATTVREALDQARAGRGENFARVVAACSLLVDGVAAHQADLDEVRTAPVEVEVLPPFAGGSGRAAEPVTITLSQAVVGVTERVSTSWTTLSHRRESQISDALTGC